MTSMAVTAVSQHLLAIGKRSFPEKITYNFVFNVDAHWMMYFYVRINLNANRQGHYLKPGSDHGGLHAPPYETQCRFFHCKNSCPDQE